MERLFGKMLWPCFSTLAGGCRIGTRGGRRVAYEQLLRLILVGVDGVDKQLARRSRLALVLQHLDGGIVGQRYVAMHGLGRLATKVVEDGQRLEVLGVVGRVVSAHTV